MKKFLVYYLKISYGFISEKKNMNVFHYFLASKSEEI